jgi:dihydroorotase-like cyclic amidohydrolase
VIKAVKRSKDINELKSSIQQEQILGQSSLVDAKSFVVMPGLVDNHVHVNEPGNSMFT